MRDIIGYIIDFILEMVTPSNKEYSKDDSDILEEEGFSFKNKK